MMKCLYVWINEKYLSKKNFKAEIDRLMSQAASTWMDGWMDGWVFP